MDGHLHHHHLVPRQSLPGIRAAVSSDAAAPADPTTPADAPTSREAADPPATTTTREASPDPPATTTTPAAQTTTTQQTTTPAPAPETTSSTPAEVATTTTTTPAAETTTSTTPRAVRTSSATPAVISKPSVIASGTAAGETTIVVSTLTQTSSSLPTSSGTSLASNNGSSSNGPSTGAVIGIVAAALVGTVIAAALVGYLFRKKWGRREEEDSPFDKDEFRRASVMLDDDQYNGGYSGGHSPQMSEHSSYGMGVAGLGRANTVLPGLGRNGTLQTPRPPSSIVNHFQRQQAMAPSYQPGQIMPSYPPGPHAQFGPNGGFPSPSPGDLYGGYPIPMNQQHQLNQNMYGQQPQYQNGYDAYGHPYPGNGLERNLSNASAYSQQDMARGPSRALSRNDGQGQRLSLVHEDHESYRGAGGPDESRSGTPVNTGVQQVYYSHGPNDSITSPRNLVSSNGDLEGTTILPGYEGFPAGQPRARSPGMDKDARAKRTLSVRNGGLDGDGRPLSYASDDAYGGVF